MTEIKCNEIVKQIADNCEDVSADYLEIGIDSFLDEGILKDIPIVKTVYSLLKVPVSLWNAYSMQKLIYFCYYMKDIPRFERIKYVNQAVSDDKNFGKKLLLTIEKIDDLDKMHMLTLLFRAYGHRDGINYDTFRRLCIALEKTYIQDLQYLKQCVASGAEYFHGEEMFNLSSVGLTVITVYGGDMLHDDIFQLLPLGQEFYECVFTEKYAFVL